MQAWSDIVRKLILQEFVTIDGFASGPDGDPDFIAAATRTDKSVDEHLLRFIDTIDTILLGANTYREFVEFWPTATSETESSRHAGFRARTFARTCADTSSTCERLTLREGVEALQRRDAAPDMTCGVAALREPGDVPLDGGTSMRVFGAVNESPFFDNPNCELSASDNCLERVTG